MKTTFFDFVSIQLNKESNEALYVQLYNQICQLIEEGKLTQGYMLPPVRKLAGFLTINVGTVVRSYKELEKNGYIFSRSGSGSYVAELLPRDRELDEGERDVVEHEPLAVLPPDIEDRYINLAGIALNPDIISVEQFKKVLIEVLDRDKGYAFSYQESQGFYPLRMSIAIHLKEHGVKALAGNVQIISGAQQGIDIVAKSFLKYGDYVFTERPTYPGAIAAFRSRGARIIDISLDEDGMNIEELEVKLRTFRPKLIYVMPNIQNPTGYSYSVVKRNRLMGLARYYNALILEDDYISDLNFQQERMAPLKAIDRDDRVIYLKSFSKIFMPGLRLAFLTIPQQFVNKVSAVKQTSDISTSGLTQRAFDLYLRQGIWQEHIGTIRSRYQSVFTMTLEAIKKYLPSSVYCSVPAGGLSFWLILPPNISAKAIVEKLRNQEVLLVDGCDFFARQAPDRFLRISFATASYKEIETGIMRLGKVVESELENVL